MWPVIHGRRGLLPAWKASFKGQMSRVAVSPWWLRNRRVLAWLVIILAVALAERVVLAAVYPPVSYNDTSSYRSMANSILAGSWAYDGTRLPGYPAFLALLGPDQIVYRAQLALGLVLTLGFFYLGWKASGRPEIGGCMALAHTLNLGQLFFEADLLTETLATFWLILSLVGAFVWLAYPARRSLWLAGGMGVALGAATLTRPLYIFMPAWLAVCLSVRLPGRKLEIDWRLLVGVLLPALLIVGGWASVINRSYHMFALSTMTGYVLVQPTSDYFEYVPDQYAALRDTYIRYRDARIAERGTAGNAIFGAIPEMMRVSGLSFYDLSRTLTRISIDLILHHPDLYLKYVARQWWYFWRAPVYWAPEQIPGVALRGFLELIVQLERLGLAAANMVFLASSLAALLWRKLRGVWNLTPFLWLLGGTLWVTSLFQALTGQEGTPRFLVPMQSLVVFWVIWILTYSVQAISRRRRTAAETMVKGA